MEWRQSFVVSPVGFIWSTKSSLCEIWGFQGSSDDTQNNIKGFTDISNAPSWTAHKNVGLLSFHTPMSWLCISLFVCSQVTNIRCLPLRKSSLWSRLTFTPGPAVVHKQGSNYRSLTLSLWNYHVRSPISLCSLLPE